MTNEEAAKERDRIRQIDRERSAKERSTSPQERADALSERNAERRQEIQKATDILKSGGVDFREALSVGGSLGRKLEREITRAAQTGRVSSWLAGETIKAEAAQRSAQQAAFRQAVTEVISSPLSPISLDLSTPYKPPLINKPEIPSEGAGTEFPPHPWQVLIRAIPNTNPVQYEYKVELNSSLYSSLSSWSGVDISGLNEWNSADAGYVVLFGVVSNLVCTEAIIQLQSSLSDKIDFAGETQTSFTAILAYLFYDENEALSIQQRAFHDFVLLASCVEGKAAIYPLAT